MSPSYASSPLHNPFAFIPPDQNSSRSPCPALNALANHGYIARNGRNIPFWTLFRATKHVYNLSSPLALLLTTVGYLTCGTVSFFSPHTSCETEPHGFIAAITHLLPSLTLNLASLSAQGPLKIAHDASLVHTDDAASCAPDPALLTQFLSLAYHPPAPNSLVGCALPPPQTHDPAEPQDGLTLADLGRLHAARAAAQPHALSKLHEQVALGECGLAWCVMRERGGTGDGDDDDSKRGVISPTALAQWFGEERLPDGWWDVGGGRPVQTIGLLEAGRRAKEVGLFEHRE